VSVPQVKVESNSPWRNQTNIPWNESIAPKAQPVVKPVNAPLERPAGFVS